MPSKSARVAATVAHRRLMANNSSKAPARPLAQQIANVLPNGTADINGVYMPGVGQSDTAGALDTWADALGIGPTWAYSLTARPTLTAAAINGLSAPLFDGSNDTGSLVGAALNWSKGVSGLTLIVVAKSVATVTAGGSVLRLSTNTGASTTRCGITRDASAGQVDVTGRRLDADTNALIRDGVSSTTLYSVDTAVYDYASALLHFYQNGTEVGTSPLNPFQTAGSTTNLASLAVTMGSDGAAGNFFHGYIAAMVCLVGAASALTQRNVARVLGRALNITVA